MGPIPFTAIVEYSRIYDVGDFDEFMGVIRALDYTYLKSNQDEQARKKAGDNAGRNTSTNNKGRGRHKGK